VNPKDIKCHLQWWGKHEATFRTIGFLPHQILSIVGSQIETKIIWFFNGHIYKSKEVSFTIKKHKKFDFCEQKLAK